MQQSKRGFGAWGWFLLIFGFLIFFSNGGFFADGTNVIAPPWRSGWAWTAPSS